MKTYVLLLLLFILGSCKFNTSPYTTHSPKYQLNEVALDRIKQNDDNSREFMIALIADTHNYYDELSSLISKLNSKRYDFIVVAGDITNLGLIDEFLEFKKHYDKVNSPCLVVVGNHDLVTNGNISFNRMFGHENMDFTYKGVQFILFNNNTWESKELVPNFEWIETQLAQHPSFPKVLVSHVSYADKDRFSSNQIKRWEQIFDTYNINYYLNGHDHNPGESLVGQTYQITIGSTVKRTYWELHFSEHGVTHKKVNF